MNRRTRRALATTVGGIILTAGIVGPASARPHDIDSVTPATVTNDLWVPCPLQRIGDRLVRCDLLTGAGVPAPSWIPEVGRLN
jgi:hypothetical protein